ncbi:MAG: hypothetical protein MJZ22_03735 [Candidatus Saccharibacteria bacterium]|nr:hypothetical protein [Candidatus Saccharibacteria bacterium]
MNNIDDMDYEELFELCYEWTNRDSARFTDRTLKVDAPDSVKKAFEKLKELEKEEDD